MGRKPLPSGIKVLQGKTPTNDAEPQAPLGCPKRPPHISGEAKKEWERITKEMDEVGVLAKADRAVLSLYCKSWARWVEAEKQLAGLPLLDIAPKTKVPMHNAYLSISNKAHDQMVKLLVELGWTPSARSRIRIDAIKKTEGLELD